MANNNEFPKMLYQVSEAGTHEFELDGVAVETLIVNDEEDEIEAMGAGWLSAYDFLLSQSAEEVVEAAEEKPTAKRGRKEAVRA